MRISDWSSDVCSSDLLAWVHSQSFGADETWTATIPKVSPLARGVRIDRWLSSIPPIPRLGKAAEYEEVDHWAQLDYLVPGVFHFYNALYPAGTAATYNGEAPPKEIGRAHVGTPVTNAHLVLRLLLQK